MPLDTARAIRWVLTDIDDTMTKDGKLVPEAYAALCALKASGLTVIAVTGRSAGWGEVHLQEWPIDGVITENGAVSYYTDSGERKELVSPTAVPNTAAALRRAAAEAFKRVPRARPAGDNALRRFDYAIDHAECVKPPLSVEEVAEIVGIFAREGCEAKPSSIHVNCWIGSFDKRAASVAFLAARFGYEDAVDRDKVLYVGDALNDEVMFAHFPNASAVANVDLWIDRMKAFPAWVSSDRYGAGFAEIAGVILAARTGDSWSPR
jgi:HAD superfamily hydrolase (TIGR01484 family)